MGKTSRERVVRLSSLVFFLTLASGLEALADVGQAVEIDAGVAFELDARAGEFQYFQLTIPPGYVAAVARLASSSSYWQGDADMYVSTGAPPTTSSFDCRGATSYFGGEISEFRSDESCAVFEPAEGILVVGVIGSEPEAEGLVLQVDLLASADVLELSSEYQPLTIAQGSLEVLSFDLHPATSVASVVAVGERSLAGLQLTSKLMGISNGMESDCSEESQEGEFGFCSLHDPAPGRYYLTVRSGFFSETVIRLRLEQVAENEIVEVANETTVLVDGSELGSMSYFKIVTPEGARNLKVETLGSQPNSDLYVRFGSIPTPGGYDCRSFQPTSQEACKVSYPEPGEYFLTVLTQRSFGQVELRASYVLESESPPASLPSQTLENQASYGPIQSEVLGKQFFSIDVPADARYLGIRSKAEQGTGDSDFYLRFGELPTVSEYDCASLAVATHESCIVSYPSEGTYYLMIDAFRSYSNLIIEARYYLPDQESDRWQWLTGKPMPFQAEDHTVTLLSSGDRLLVGGRGNSRTHNADPAVQDRSTGTWAAAKGTSRVSFHDHSATQLLSGDLLLTGQWYGSYVYRSEDGSWTYLSGLDDAQRWHHTATRLQSGEVLVTGGGQNSTRDHLRHSAVFDSTNAWTATEPMIEARSRHTSTLLPDGQVLIAGGEGFRDDFAGEYLQSAELFDPASGRWQPLPPMHVPRAEHVAVFLGDQRVLVAGGEAWPATVSAEILDLDSLQWRLVEAPPRGFSDTPAALMPTGDVIIVANGQLLAFDSADETWHPVFGGATPGYSHATLITDSGDLLVSGGRIAGQDSTSQSNTLIHVGSEHRFSSNLSFAPRHTHHARLHDGRPMIVGGQDFTSHSQTFDPVARAWGESVSIDVDASSVTVLEALPDGDVLLIGERTEVIQDGSSNGFSTSDVQYRFDAQSRTWLEEDFPDSLDADSLSAAVMPSGHVLFVHWNTTEVYDPVAGTWSEPRFLSNYYRRPTLTVLGDGSALVFGGTTPKAEVIQLSLESFTSRPVGEASLSRTGHTADRLLSGEVLVAGGINGDSLATCELYDPVSETWRPTGSMNHPRADHRSLLLPSGRVVVSGGIHPNEIYDRSTETWTVLPPPASAGLIGAMIDTEEMLITDFGDAVRHTFLAPPLRRFQPVIDSAPQVARFGEPITMTGTGFFSVSEATNGRTSQSVANYPIVWIWSWDNSYTERLDASVVSTNTLDPTTIRIDELPPTLHPGPHYLAVVSNGVPSKPVRVDVVCSLDIDGPPTDQAVPLGTPATFEVSSQGGRNYQWYKNGEKIEGATGATYTTPPTGIESAGDQYTVRVGTGCMEDDAPPATLQLVDDQPPVASVALPRGGEYWLLSSESGAPNVETVAWDMADDIRLCAADVRLVYSLDGGQTYQSAPDDSGLPRSFGEEGLCPHPGLNVTNLQVDVPTEPPAGVAGALYKIELTVTDHAGLTSVARSSKPFFIVEPNPELIKTLILTHPGRLTDHLGLTTTQASELTDRLHELAAHPRVQGRVVDLSNVPSLETLYEAWDDDSGSVTRANAVLFGDGGLHEYLLDLQRTFTEVENLVVVGDDRIIPKARILDRTALPESAYPQGDDLTAGGSTVAQALAQDQFLSDDLLGVRRPISIPWSVDDTELGAFLPEVAVGRLVETFEDISTTIATFISRDGVVDLDAIDPVLGHKVLVTGYDFLIDSARRIRDRWKTTLGLPEPFLDDEISPVHGRLIGETWGESTLDQRRDVLREALGGMGGEPYAVLSLNGHATHYEEGVPGTTALDIQGVPALDLYGIDACFEPSDGPLNLTGSVIYAVGCHGALNVPGTCSSDDDHSLDLPQAFLRSGALAYVANTGYGWGLVSGIGYSERLMELFTEEMTLPGTTTVGRLVQRAKLRYFQESIQLDPYDVKTLLQWNLYGLPMTTIKRSASASTQAHEQPSAGPAPTLPEILQRTETSTLPYRIEPTLADPGRSTLPAHLTQLNLNIELTGPGVYRKYNAGGQRLPNDPGCPDPLPGEPPGCFYTLNGISEQGTGATDLPIQPFLTYDSRLSGTSLHGVVWMGGAYTQESRWTPVVAELASNHGDFSDNNLGPRLIRLRPRPRRRPTVDEHQCRPSDFDTSSVLMVTGETLRARSDPDYSLQRLYDRIDLESLYFNDQGLGGNCDRQGPTFDEAPDGHHTVKGSGIEWAVPVSDEAGVWRVVVLYDVGAGPDGRGRWAPVELADDGSGTWRGALRLNGVEELVYLVQAVDRRGNVSWVDFEWVGLPASGVAQDLVAATWVTLGDASVDLALADVQATPDPVVASGLLTLEGRVENRGPDAASGVELTIDLAEGMVFEAASNGWACDAAGLKLTCRRATPIVAGHQAGWVLFVRAPASEGLSMAWVSVAGSEPDLDPSNNTAAVPTQVLSGADLAITKVHDRGVVEPGGLLGYTIAVTNHGPEDVYGALVRDLFPTALEDIVWTCVSTLGSRCSASGSTQLIDTVDLLSGGSVIYAVSARVVLHHAGPIVNEATVESPTPSLDGNSANNMAAVATMVASDAAQIFDDGFESGEPDRWGSVHGLQ